MIKVGESEKKVQQIFKVAKEYSPCIVFFDEIQAIFGNKEFESDHGRKVRDLPSLHPFPL